MNDKPLSQPAALSPRFHCPSVTSVLLTSFLRRLFLGISVFDFIAAPYFPASLKLVVMRGMCTVPWASWQTPPHPRPQSFLILHLALMQKSWLSHFLFCEEALCVSSRSQASWLLQVALAWRGPTWRKSPSLCSQDRQRALPNGIFSKPEKKSISSEV